MASYTGSQCQDLQCVHHARLMTKEEMQAARRTALDDAFHHETLRDELNETGNRHAGDSIEATDERIRSHHLKSAQDYYEQAEKHRHLHLASEKDAEALQHRIVAEESTLPEVRSKSLSEAKLAEAFAKHHIEMSEITSKGH
ncbi:hypothetical protein FRC14_003370 [Serendipita sp. 396]|nr:hypothetical protein FRC14_003370 [Serendipita sp. 396]KAG8784335.1 hypothetical protein FRC15_003409 [Serendipita sp. 397]KAG8826946.1 hypothetical protein FRC19_006570 [Serendipita sp. 401]KAG8836320.1 hypothetical protein FRC18_011607 [Serendipita sp. 400]KAG8868280.1 hypothetical protein FRC20_003671 [Serendipita sp. 405]KAG9057611.1 hypothetical protein FS842_005315 [Serendipita sp. 407]